MDAHGNEISLHEFLRSETYFSDVLKKRSPSKQDNEGEGRHRRSQKQLGTNAVEGEKQGRKLFHVATGTGAKAGISQHHAMTFCILWEAGLSCSNARLALLRLRKKEL